MYSFYRKDTFCNIEPGDIFREGVVLDEHRHKITTWKEFHDKVQMDRVLK